MAPDPARLLAVTPPAVVIERFPTKARVTKGDRTIEVIDDFGWWYLVENGRRLRRVRSLDHGVDTARATLSSEPP